MNTWKEDFWAAPHQFEVRLDNDEIYVSLIDNYPEDEQPWVRLNITPRQFLRKLLDRMNIMWRNV